MRTIITPNTDTFYAVIAFVSLVVTKPLILLKKWKLIIVLSAKLSNWKKIAISFLAKAFPSCFAAKLF